MTNKMFKIFFKGYESKDDIKDENRMLLGNFRYDNESVNTLQFFAVQVI
jgi:hypothetical protein